MIDTNDLLFGLDNDSMSGRDSALLDLIVYAPHGRELEGESPLRMNHPLT